MELFELIAECVALGIECLMLLVITIGTARAIYAIAAEMVTREVRAPVIRDIWLHYAAWILLALEFALAADLIRTVIAPAWPDIGMLGAIAAIRIALGYFLGRDISEIRGPSHEASAGD